MFLSITAFALSFLGVVLFSFVLWRRLKEDYPHEQIFFLTLLFLFVGFLSLVIIDKRLGDFSFWGVFVINILAGFYFIKKLGFKFFESIDALAPSWFWFIFFFSLAGFLRDWKNIMSLSYPTAALLSLFTYHFLLARYRRFSWYPSGKVGFAGFFSLAAYFVLQALVAIYKTLVLSFNSASVDFAVNGLLSLVLVFIVYMRSGREGAERIIRFKRK